MTTSIISDNNIVQVIEETNGVVVNTTQNIVQVNEDPFLVNVEVIGIQGPSPTTNVSVATANGFAGTSSGGNNPVLTLSTTVNGLIEGNGTELSAATNIDNIPIGANTPSTGAFTTLTGNIDCGTF